MRSGSPGTPTSNLQPIWGLRRSPRRSPEGSRGRPALAPGRSGQRGPRGAHRRAPIDKRSSWRPALPRQPRQRSGSEPRRSRARRCYSFSTELSAGSPLRLPCRCVIRDRTLVAPGATGKGGLPNCSRNHFDPVVIPSHRLRSPTPKLGKGWIWNLLSPSSPHHLGDNPSRKNWATGCPNPPFGPTFGNSAYGSTRWPLASAIRWVQARGK